MSQYGARGRALAGQDAAAILAHYYRGTTLGTVAPTSTIRVRVLLDWKATASAPLTISAGGRRGPSTASRGRSRSMPSCGSARPRRRDRDDVATPGDRAGRPVLRDGPKPASVVVRGTTATSRLELASKASSYDEYRGVLRLAHPPRRRPSRSSTSCGSRRICAASCRSRCHRAWPTEALEAQAIASRSYAARRLRPGVSYYDVTDDTSSQVYRGALGEKATTNAILAAEPGVVLRSGSAIANTLVPLDRRRRDREQRERLRLVDRREGRRRRQLPARIAGPGARRDVIRCGIPVRHLADDDVHRSRSSRPGSRPMRGRAVGTLHAARPARSGRVRAARSASRSSARRDEDGLGRRVPLGLQRPAPGDGSDAPEHAVRVRADPLTPATVAR